MINAALEEPQTQVAEVGVTGLRHCLYKCKNTQQLWTPRIEAPYDSPEQTTRLRQLYHRLHANLHRKGCPLKLLYEQLPYETMLGWVSVVFITFAPLRGSLGNEISLKLKAIF